MNYEKLRVILKDKSANSDLFADQIIDIVKQCDGTASYQWPEGLPIKCNQNDNITIYRGLQQNHYEAARYLPFWEYVWYFAPDDAMYATCDCNLQWKFWKHRPTFCKTHWVIDGVYECFKFFPHPSPADSLMERPVK